MAFKTIILTVALIFSASNVWASDCDSRSSVGMFASSVAPSSVKTVKGQSAKTSAQSYQSVKATR